MKDYYADRRMNHLRWSFRRWWEDIRLLLLAAIIIVIWLLLTYYDERDKRHLAEAQVDYLIASLTNAPCYTTERPTSILIAGDSQEAVGKALSSAASAADNIRMGWLIARADKGKK